jgi:lysophospholipase L1-like esterase
MIIAWSLLAVLALAACDTAGSATPSPVASAVAGSTTALEAGDGTTAAETERRTPWRLVTLGDSFTYGAETDLPRRDSWPSQLVESLERGDVSVRLRNFAEQGNSSSQVLGEQLDQVGPEKPDIVTLQVGINDLLYNETEWYRDNLATILDELMGILPPEQIFVITTPGDAFVADAYGARAEVREAIDWLNDTLAIVASERGIDVIDIGLVNGLGEDDPSLVAGEGGLRYPTAKQYAGWAEVIGPYIYRALAQNEP